MQLPRWNSRQTWPREHRERCNGNALIIILRFTSNQLHSFNWFHIHRRSVFFMWDEAGEPGELPQTRREQKSNNMPTLDKIKPLQRDEYSVCFSSCRGQTQQLHAGSRTSSLSVRVCFCEEVPFAMAARPVGLPGIRRGVLCSSSGIRPMPGPMWFR